VWFFGGGAVHKGLDLVIDVFAKNPQLTLNIIGNLEQEQDFLNAYQYELSELPNITYHGPLNPAGKKFNDVTSRVFCFIAPSCSESISTAVATCLQLGLMPIISRDTGIDLPDGCGIYLESCSVEEIEAAVLKVSGMDNDSLTDQIARCQQTALRQYSREKFSQDMTRYLAKVLVSLGKPL
ncbi:MAG TPA: glycosyltransferase, partial [Candidatus Saccharimonadales bacterium]|nr:glycosyltransferase [Candidatus Saccharimonadales bacterium]